MSVLTRLSPLLCVVALSLVAGHPAYSAEPPCASSLAERIPPRSPAAPGGHEFVRYLAPLDDDARESAILDQLLAGNIPQFLRVLTAVSLNRSSEIPSRTPRAVVCVLPDYLAVGSDQDFFLTPMRLGTALTVAARFRFSLPTRRMVDAIYAQAPIHLQPQPLPASAAMRSTAYYWHHNELVLAQRTDIPLPLGTLTAGDKKDLVLSNRLWDHLSSVAIYGWHEANGRAIQPLSTFHGARYADYSHGVRLVSATAYIDGEALPLLSLLQDPRLAGLFSDEGRIREVNELLQILGARSQPRISAMAQ